MFWLFSACAAAEDTGTVEQSIEQVENVPEESEAASSSSSSSSCKKVPLVDEDAKLIQQHQSRDFTHPSAPSDEHNDHQNHQHKQTPSPVAAAAAVTTTTPPTSSSGGGSSDEVTPTPAEPLGTFSHFFHSQCVQECADGAGDLADEDGSFLAVFDNQNFVAADRYEGAAYDLDDPQPAAARRSLKGLTVRVHAPRQILPTTGYEVQWQVDPPQFTGLYRVQAKVVRERFETQYACSETGRPIEVHQEGERLEVARLTCYRMRPRILRQHYDTSWKQRYPQVAKFLQTVPEGPIVESYYQPRGMIQSVTQLLLEDLYVHPDYRGGGLGLSLLDHACRKVGDALASIVLGLPSPQPSSRCEMEAAPHDEPQRVESRNQDEDDDQEDDDDEETVNPEARALEHYFGLLGFVHIHQDYMARAMGRVLLEEACPCAPQLDPNRIEIY